jgi:hypothetical protein
MANELLLDENKHILCTVPIAAKVFEVSPQGLNKCIRENKFPKNKNLVDLNALAKLRREIAQQQLQDLSDTEKKLKAEAKYKNEKAKQEEMITLQMMGELIPQEQVKDSLEMLFLDIRQTLLTVPDNIKTRVYGIDPDIATECEEVASEIITKILTRLASGNNIGRAENVGTKPKKRYTKRTTSVSAAAAADSE